MPTKGAFTTLRRIGVLLIYQGHSDDCLWEDRDRVDLSLKANAVIQRPSWNSDLYRNIHEMRMIKTPSSDSPSPPQASGCHSLKLIGNQKGRWQSVDAITRLFRLMQNLERRSSFGAGLNPPVSDGSHCETLAPAPVRNADRRTDRCVS